MDNKRQTIARLSEQTEPKLTRAEIARQAKCSTAYVTQILGAQRAYKRRSEALQATQEAEAVVG